MTEVCLTPLKYILYKLVKSSHMLGGQLRKPVGFNLLLFIQIHLTFSFELHYFCPKTKKTKIISHRVRFSTTTKILMRNLKYFRVSFCQGFIIYNNFDITQSLGKLTRLPELKISPLLLLVAADHTPNFFYIMSNLTDKIC